MDIKHAKHAKWLHANIVVFIAYKYYYIGMMDPGPIYTCRSGRGPFFVDSNDPLSMACAQKRVIFDVPKTQNEGTFFGRPNRFL